MPNKGPANTGTAHTENRGDTDETAARFLVALGASAGGLSALQHFFRHLPALEDVAYVVVTHMHPNQVNRLSEILSRETSLPVVNIEDNMVLTAGRVHVIQPGTLLGVADGRLKVQICEEHVLAPIDYFFRSMATDFGEHGIGIVLSGAGHDGALGAKAIKGANGVVLAQDPNEAEYELMPEAAIETGLVDAVLGTEALAEKVAVCVTKLRDLPMPVTAQDLDEADRQHLDAILRLLAHQCKQDFTGYKMNTIARRVFRRMAVTKARSLGDYYKLITDEPDEAEILSRELLIGVTQFFREPEAFDYLTREVLPGHLRANVEEPFRVWVPGCSTGEEAYSLAMLIDEVLNEEGIEREVQIFATDIDPRAIKVARRGRYPSTIRSDVSDKRLHQYFNRIGDDYVISKKIRGRIVFSVQNLVSDPAFSQLDLVSCRNLLIYFDSALQQRVIPLLHMSLKRNGILFLGASESIGQFGELFESLHKKWKIFKRRPAESHKYLTQNVMPVARRPASPYHEFHTQSPDRPEVTRGVTPDSERAGFVNAVQAAFLRHYVPPTVVVDEGLQLRYVYGSTGEFFEPAQGEPTRSLLDMCRPGLRSNVRMALNQAWKADAPVLWKNVQVEHESRTINVDLKLAPLKLPGLLDKAMMVSFVNTSTAEKAPVSVDAKTSRDVHTAELETELSETKTRLQSTIEQLETSNEELKSTNEELQSSNEELQSSNEELETTKEETQSLNEELATVNSELENKVEQLSASNDDMKNLLESTQIATIFVDNDQRIQRFTREAVKVMNVIPSDIGRPLRDLTPKLKLDSITQDVESVLNSLKPVEKIVKAENDQAYSMRIVPYRTDSNKINGVVLNFIEAQHRHPVPELVFELGRLISGRQLLLLECTVKGTIQSVSDQSCATPLVGRAITSLIARSSRKKFQKYYEALQKTPETMVLEIEPSSLIASKQKLVLALSPVFDARERLIRFVGVFYYPREDDEPDY